MRPRPLPMRVLAALIAIGVGALLVGLSVAPDALPGDTFQATPRTAIHKSFLVGVTADHGGRIGTDTDPLSIPQVLAILPRSGPIAISSVRWSPRPSSGDRLPTPTRSAPESRGPPGIAVD